MQSIWVVGGAEDIISVPLPLSEGYFHYGGSVYGNATYAPVMHHFFDGPDKCALKH